MMKFVPVTIVGLAMGLCGLNVTARGGIVGVSGDILLIDAPLSASDGVLADDLHAFAWNEQQGTVLQADLNVDITVAGLYDSEDDLTPGHLSAGTLVRSHVIHFDTSSANVHRDYSGSVEFDAPIIAVIVTWQNLDASDTAVGSVTTTYYKGQGRGLEDFAQQSADEWVRWEGSNLIMSASGGVRPVMDEIRVITEVPAPAAGLGLALSAAGWLLTPRRRRNHLTQHSKT